MKRGEDPYDDLPVTGEIPGISAKTVQKFILDKLGGVREIGQSLLPKDHGLTIKFGKDQPEIPLDNLEVEEHETGYKTRIVQGIGEHKKEIAVGTLTVMGLVTAIELIHIYRKTKK
jgi:hypothetical protein